MERLGPQATRESTFNFQVTGSSSSTRELNHCEATFLWELELTVLACLPGSRLLALGLMSKSGLGRGLGTQGIALAPVSLCNGVTVLSL